MGVVACWGRGCRLFDEAILATDNLFRFLCIFIAGWVQAWYLTVSTPGVLEFAVLWPSSAPGCELTLDTGTTWWCGSFIDRRPGEYCV